MSLLKKKLKRISIMTLYNRGRDFDIGADRLNLELRESFRTRLSSTVLMARTKHDRINNSRATRCQPHSTGVVHEQHGRTIAAESIPHAKRTRNYNANHPLDSHLIDMENDHSYSTSTGEIKTRGPTSMAHVYKRRKSVEVEFDDLGKPIGSNKSEYVEFIGTLVRNGSSLPLDIKDWRKVPDSFKRNLLETVKEKFYGALNFEEFTLLTLAKSWRTWKNRVKNKYFNPNSSLEENLNRRPDSEDERVHPDQWKNLVLYWSSDEARKISTQNKDNRALNNMMHLTGKKSFSQIRDHMKKEAREAKNAQLDDGESNEDYDDQERDYDPMDDEPSQMDLFGRCYTKNGETSNPIIAVSLRKMKELSSQLSPGSKDIGPNDIISQVVRQDKDADVYGDIPKRGKSSRMRVTYKKELNALKERADQQDKIIMEQNKQIQELIKMNKQRADHESHPEDTRVPSPSSSHQLATSFRSSSLSVNKIRLQVGAKVYLRSVLDSSKTVAIGRLQSLDQSVRVGKNWCEVIISVAVEFDEDLVRPISCFRTIGDAIGETISWPQNLVYMNEV